MREKSRGFLWYLWVFFVCFCRQVGLGLVCASGGGERWCSGGGMEGDKAVTRIVELSWAEGEARAVCKLQVAR